MSARILIGIPSHRGWVRAELAHSLVQTAACLRAKGVDTCVEFSTGALVQVSRNLLVRQALNGPASHLLMVDDDVAFAPEAPLQLLSWGEDIVGGALPCRHKPRFLVTSPKAVPGRAPLLEVGVIGTGFLLLSRRCLERMVAVHGAHSFAVLPALPGWPGFEDPETFVPEDVAFCTRWQALGGRIFCDPGVGLAHFGTSCASTSMAEALKAGPVQLMDDSMASGETLAG